MQIIKFNKAVITSGEKGCTLFTKNNKAFSAPALSTKVLDKVGSGDAMLSIISLSKKAGIDPNLCLLFGALGASQSLEAFANENTLDKNYLIKRV